MPKMVMKNRKRKLNTLARGVKVKGKVRFQSF